MEAEKDSGISGSVEISESSTASRSSFSSIANAIDFRT